MRHFIILSCMILLIAGCSNSDDDASGDLGTRDAATSMRVFVTSQAFQGNFGGRSEADQQCQNLADAQGLTGVYRAWLSDRTGSPQDDPTWFKSNLPYEMLDGTVIASNWDDLVDGKLTTGILLTETATPLRHFRVWTGTDATGEATSANCHNWTTHRGTVGAHVGFTDISDEEWTVSLVDSCSFMGHLYCFEQ